MFIDVNKNSSHYSFYKSKQRILLTKSSNYEAALCNISKIRNSCVSSVSYFMYFRVLIASFVVLTCAFARASSGSEAAPLNDILFANSFSNKVYNNGCKKRIYS